MTLIRTLLSHYRRHPVQALFLLTGIVVANALLAGTLLINAQARASYHSGEHYLSTVPLGQIQYRDRRRTIDESDYIRLRRLGFDMLVPVLRQLERTQDGEPLELLGIDAFALPRTIPVENHGFPNGSADSDYAGFAFPPWQLWVAPARLEQLGLEEGERIKLPSGGLLPPLTTVSDQQLGHRLLMDIRALQNLTGKAGELSSIQVFKTSNVVLEELLRKLPDHLEFVHRKSAPDPAELTRSFHLNLAAMGLLAFVVGIFLIYNALTFSYTDRRHLIRKLLLAGVTRGQLAWSLLSELTLFLAAGTLLGSWLGAHMAAWLLPGVGRTLAQLYGVYISYPDGLIPSGIWLPVMMTMVAGGLCVLFPLREALHIPLLERREAGWQLHAVLRRDRLLARTGLLTLVAAALIGLSATQLWIALAGMACLLIGTALLLPAVLRTLIGGMERLVPPQQARFSWLLADSRWLLGPASLALMAMTLALVANSGLNTMINSFRGATDDWLDQRLVADLYLRNEQKLEGLADWLATQHPELKVSERYQKGVTRLSPSGMPVAVEIVSLRDGDRFRDTIELMRGGTTASAKFTNSNGVYISERAWRIDGWQVGASLRLCENRVDTPILGVYRDYGNPQSQWMLSRQLFRECWPGQAAAGLSVHGPAGTDWSRIRVAIGKRFGLQGGKIINQNELKRVGLAVFDRTFTVTRALNALTLLVAGIGIFCAISAIHHHRVGHQALLSSLGMTRRERGAMLLLQWGMLGLLCMLLVWPFGTLLAAYLASVVTPVAFGWSFELQLEWGHYLVLAALATACLVIAVVLPSLRLLYTSPAAMLREQNV